MARACAAARWPPPHTARIDAINEEPELIADSVVRADEPYFNMLTTRRSFLNGTLSEFYRERQGVGIFTITSPAHLDVLPSIPYAEADTWSEYTAGASHSGVLTTPSFLYRFPTQRARVNHFYEAFLCKTFVPLVGPAASAGGQLQPREQPGQALRLQLLPRHHRAHRRALGPLSTSATRCSSRPSSFPRFDPKCRDCALAGDTNCGGECGQYVMQAYDGDGANSLGMLKTYLYRTADEEANIEAGPQLLVRAHAADGDLERCTVKRIWTEFLGRPMTAEEQRLYLHAAGAGLRSTTTTT